MFFSISSFTVVMTLVLGYLSLQYFWPRYNKNLGIIDASKSGDYDRVISLTSKNSDEKSLDIYLHAAHARIKKSLYEDAFSWFEKALLLPNLKVKDQIYLERKIGDLYFQQKNYKLAELRYRTALSLNPKDELISYKLSESLFYAGHYNLCRKNLRSLLKENPSLLDAHKLYAETLAELKKYSNAIRHYGIVKRAGDEVLSLNYGRTLQNLKIWDQAYEVFINLHKLGKNLDRELIFNLLSSCVALQKYHEALGFIDNFMKTTQDNRLFFELRYQRAEIFFLKGDEFKAIKEYHLLYAECPSYKDLAAIIQRDKCWIDYEFLSSYFTSNESIFEFLVTKMTPSGSRIVRRTREYFLCLHNEYAYIFYRSIRAMSNRLLTDIDILLLQSSYPVKIMYLFSLQGLSERQTLSGKEFELHSFTQDKFLSSVKKALSGRDYYDNSSPDGFVSVFDDLPQVIPIFEPMVQELLKESESNPIFQDEILSKALE